MSFFKNIYNSEDDGTQSPSMLRFVMVPKLEWWDERNEETKIVPPDTVLLRAIVTKDDGKSWSLYLKVNFHIKSENLLHSMTLLSHHHFLDHEGHTLREQRTS